MDLYPSPTDDEKYEEPWKLVEDYRKSTREDFRFHSMSGELPSHFREAHASRDVYLSSNNSLSLENQPVGVPPHSPYTHFSRVGSSHSIFNDRFSTSRACSTPKQVIDRSQEVTNKRPLSLNFHSGASSHTPSGERNRKQLSQEEIISNFRNPDREVSKSPSLHDESHLHMEDVGENSPDKPKERQSSQSHVILQDADPAFNHSSNGFRKQHEVRFDRLIADFSEARQTIEQLQIRLQKEEALNKELLSQNSERLGISKLKDKKIDSLEMQIEGLSAKIEALQTEKNQMYKDLQEKDIQEQEREIVHENQLKSLNSKLHKIEELNDILQKENLGLQASQHTRSEEKIRLINQSNGYAHTISSLQKHETEFLEFQLRLQAHLGQGNSLTLSQLEGEIRRLVKDRDYLEAENRMLADKIEGLSSPRERGGSRGLLLERTDSLEKDVKELNSHHKQLTQKHRAVLAQIQTAEAQLTKSSEAYKQLVNQANLLEPKLCKQQETVNSIQEELQRLLTTKSELSKKKRELKMEVGSLESSLSKSFKSSSRRRAPLSNMSLTRSDSQASNRPPSALSSPGIKAKHGLNEALASLFPPTASLDTKEEPQSDCAQKRVDELEAMVEALHKAVGLLRQHIEGHTHLYPSIRPELASQETDDAIDKLDDLCRLLSNTTSDFANLVQVEKRFFALQEENEALYLELDQFKKRQDVPLSAETDQLRAQLAQLAREKEDQLTQLITEKEGQLTQLIHEKDQLACLAQEKEAQISRITQDFEAQLAQLTFDNEALASRLENQVPKRLIALEDELTQTQEAENHNMLRLRSLEQERNQLSFDYGRASQDLRYLSQELEAYKSKLAYSQEELQAIRNDVVLYQQDIFHLEEQLRKSKKPYPSPAPSVMASPVPRSRRLSDVPGCEDLLNIIEAIRDAHKRQLTNIRTLLLGTSRSELESAILDLQLELKELDLQATLSLGRKPPPSRTSSVADSNHSPQKFIYSKPYKEFCYQYRTEAKYLRACLTRQEDCKSDLVLQKQYLTMLVRSHETGRRDSTFTLTVHMFLSPSVRKVFPCHSAKLSISRTKLRRCVWVIVALIRAQRQASQWAQVTQEYHRQRAALSVSLFQKSVIS